MDDPETRSQETKAEVQNDVINQKKEKSKKGQRTKDKGQRTKDKGQRTKDKGQRTKDKGQRTKDKGTKGKREKGQRTKEGRSHDVRLRRERVDPAKDMAQWSVHSSLVSCPLRSSTLRLHR